MKIFFKFELGKKLKCNPINIKNSTMLSLKIKIYNNQ